MNLRKAVAAADFVDGTVVPLIEYPGGLHTWWIPTYRESFTSSSVLGHLTCPRPKPLRRLG